MKENLCVEADGIQPLGGWGRKGGKVSPVNRSGISLKERRGDLDERSGRGHGCNVRCKSATPLRRRDDVLESGFLRRLG